jgi:hypothetical protein
MPDTTYWDDGEAREAFMERGRAIYCRIRADLRSENSVVAIEPDSGAYCVGATLGQANDLIREQYPDQWVYFCRTDDPNAEIMLPTW